MSASRSTRVLLAAAFLCVAGSTLRAQCLDWRAFPESGATNERISAVHAHTDSFGPALFFAGYNPTSFPSVIMRWDGSVLAPAGTGITGLVNVMQSFDGGSGSNLYVGGGMTFQGQSHGLLRWNGSAWSVPGGGFPSQSVWDMEVFDDGSGSALYAVGPLVQAGSLSVPGIARWNGTTWSALPAPPVSGFGALQALAVFDDGSGPALFVGGNYTTTAGGTTLAQGFFKFQAGAWSVPYPAAPISVRALAGGDLGNGGQLFVLGKGVTNLQFALRWDGAAFQPIGSPITCPSETDVGLDVLDDGSGAKLYVRASPPCSTRSARVWDGSSWSDLTRGTTPAGCAQGGPLFVTGLTVFDDGGGPRIVGSGTSAVFGTGPTGLSTWTGTQWVPTIPHKGLDRRILSLHVFDDGAGDALYAGGDFCAADTAMSSGLARWSGTGWSAVPGFSAPTFAGFTPSAMLTWHNPQARLVIGGRHVYSWNGTSIPTFYGSPSGSGATVFCLEQFGTDLYAGGSFARVDGNFGPNIIRLGITGWAPLGLGVNGAVNALKTFDDGTGPAIYAGGTFDVAGSTNASRIARWDGANWTALGTGLNDLCDALIVFDDGTGPALYAAGTFTTAGGLPASRVARWKNNTWSALGAGLNAQVLSLGVFDDGSGPALYAGGNFTASGSTLINRVAKWNGVSWSALGLGVNGAVWALESFDDGTGVGPQLFTGGEMTYAANFPSKSIASWRGCGGAISSFCSGDGSVGDCPCANFGLAGHGCENSFATGGALLGASGTANPDTISLQLSDVIPGTAASFFQGKSLLSAPFGLADGVLCTGGSLIRLGTVFVPSGTIAFPAVGNPSISAQSAAAGDPILPGSVRAYQVWYRDSNLAYCPAPFGASSNLSNGVRIQW